jgi:hypothetical protein
MDRDIHIAKLRDTIIKQEALIRELTVHLKVTNCLLELKLTKEDAVDLHYVEEMKKIVLKAEKEN